MDEWSVPGPWSALAAVTPSALKDWLRVYIASRGSDGQEPLQIIF